MLGALTTLVLVLVLVLAACTAVPTPVTVATENPPGVSDTLRATKECMEEAGFVAEYDNQGGLVGNEMPAEQSELWLEASWRCMDESGMSNPQYSDAQLSELYDLEVENYACLIDAGYLPDEPPSRQQFIDTWGTASSYQAIVAVGEADPSSLRTATAACPPPRWSFG